jgi:predicted O-linked N-acetylglucosamine transferase (SPINDLY family)
MPYGRFCYQPPPEDMPMAEPPCLDNGHVTFGSFNNVAKIGPGVLDLWAQILHALPDARLIMKWRTLSADSVKERFTQSFVQRGIAAERIEFRSAVSHALLFAEYNEIDISLDPFPFGGATTSCESLWMGVPVVTWPGERLASRQTYGFLHIMGYDELAAASREDYVALAVALARDPERLRRLRRELRPALVNAPFSDGAGFTAMLEQAFRIMWRRHCKGEKPVAFDIPPTETEK